VGVRPELEHAAVAAGGHYVIGMLDTCTGKYYHSTIWQVRRRYCRRQLSLAICAGCMA